MFNIADKKMLERKFADNFASPFYPILAELYLLEGDVSRAHKVCEIGLNHDPHNIDGKFVFSKVAMYEKRFIVAEKWLKQVVDENPAHFNALRILIRLEIKLSRSPKTIQNYINRLLQFLPEDTECIEWLNNLQARGAIDPTLSSSLKPKTKPQNNVPTQIPAPNTEKIYKIEEIMATLTMARVLKSQQHYHAALAVLDVLESKGGENNQITQQKEEILRLISATKK